MENGTGSARNTGSAGRWLCAFVSCGIILLFGTRACADVARILATDFDAAQARVDLIQQAQAEIEISYFAFDFDNVSLMMLTLVRDAARRGVRVRLVLDARENTIPDAIQAHLIDCGVRIREFHPVRWVHPGWRNRRMHDKVVIVDRRQVIVGSRNIRDEHFGLTQHNYVNRDLYIAGQIGIAAHQYFMCLWTSKHVFPTSLDDYSPGSPQGACHHWLADSVPTRPCCPNDRCCGIRWASECLDTVGAVLSENDVVRVDGGADWAAGLTEIPAIGFMYDPAGQKCGTVGTDEMIRSLLNCARCSIVLETPYFVASAKLKHVLLAAVKRGVRVQVLTNSLSSTDAVLAYAAYTNEKKMLVSHGIELYEFRSCDTLHAKSMLIDGCISVIGSYNFDPRSEKLNTEVAAVIRDRNFGRELLASINRHMAYSVEIGKHGRPITMPVCLPGTDANRLRELRCKRLLALLLKRCT